MRPCEQAEGASWRVEQKATYGFVEGERIVWRFWEAVAEGVEEQQEELAKICRVESINAVHEDLQRGVKGGCC